MSASHDTRYGTIPALGWPGLRVSDHHNLRAETVDTIPGWNVNEEKQEPIADHHFCFDAQSWSLDRFNPTSSPYACQLAPAILPLGSQVHGGPGSNLSHPATTISISDDWQANSIDISDAQSRMNPINPMEIPQGLPKKAMKPGPNGKHSVVVVFPCDALGSHITIRTALNTTKMVTYTGVSIPEAMAEIMRRSKITVQLQWPGYNSFAKQVNITSRKKADLSPLATLAHLVAKCIARFIAENQRYEIDPEHRQWRIGPGHIGLDNVELIGLRQVTLAGVQPILHYRQT